MVAWSRIAFAALFLAPGCSSVSGQLSDIIFIPNASSDKRSEESVALELAYAEPIQLISDAKGIPFEIFGGGLSAKFAGTAVSQISETLAAEAARYEANYAAQSSSDSFYFSNQHESDLITNMQLAGFQLVRTIRKDAGREPHTAMSVCVMALPARSEKLFYLIPVSWRMRYAKAKLIGFDLLSPFGVDLLNPWEIVTDPIGGEGYDLPPADNDLNMTVTINLEYLHYQRGEPSGDPELTTTPAGPHKFGPIAVRVGKDDEDEPQKGYFPGFDVFRMAKGEEYNLDCVEGAAGGPDSALAQLRNRIASLPYDDFDRMRLAGSGAVFPSAPRILDDESGNGAFTIKVTVDEFDDYGKRVKSVSSAFEKEKSTLQRSLTDMLNGEK